MLIQAQNTHQQVKTKILERMGEWTEMFKKNPDLGIMEQAYMKLKSQSTKLATLSIVFTLLTLRRSQSLPTRCAHKTADYKCG
jgi:hypothetical protein